MLHNSNVATRLPAQDLERARAFYAQKLGLEPIEERPGGLKYKCGNGYFALFESTGPRQANIRRWLGKWTTSMPWWPNYAAAESCLRNTIFQI